VKQGDGSGEFRAMSILFTGNSAELNIGRKGNSLDPLQKYPDGGEKPVSLIVMDIVAASRRAQVL
jgi:hypothetical protein